MGQATRIGFIGLGTMGLPMSINLTKKCGLTVIGYDTVPARREMLDRDGGGSTDDVRTLYKESDVVFLCLPTTEAMRDCVLACLDNARPGTIIVELGSSAPDAIREIDSLVKAKGMHLLDSPVSGGEAGAIDGSLVIMTGGEEEIFAKVLPLLMCMGVRATYMGGSGNGSVAKLANNMIVGIHIGAIGEAYAYATRAGLNPRTLFEAIRGGLADSAVMTRKIPKIISRDFSPSARAEILQKDLKSAVALADAMGVAVPLTRKVLDDFYALETMGKADEDHMAIVRIVERNMGVEVK